MSLSEHLGDSVRDQSDRGTVSVTVVDRPPPTLLGTVIRIILAIIFIALYFHALHEYYQVLNRTRLIYACWGLFVYTFFGFFIRPQPGSYMGLKESRHGSHDDPWTNTDDINRLLAFLKVFFLPGMVIGEAFVDSFRLLLRFLFPAWYAHEKVPPRRLSSIIPDRVRKKWAPDPLEEANSTPPRRTRSELPPHSDNE